MENQDLTSIFGTSRSFKEWLHDSTNPLVYCLLTLEGKEFLAKNSYAVELHQKTAQHDTFTITVPDDALDRFEGYIMENSKNLLGKELTITYWRFGKIRQTFSGIIGRISNKKDEGGGGMAICILPGMRRVYYWKQVRTVVVLRKEHWKIL